MARTARARIAESESDPVHHSPVQIALSFDLQLHKRQHRVSEPEPLWSHDSIYVHPGQRRHQILPPVEISDRDLKRARRPRGLTSVGRATAGVGHDYVHIGHAIGLALLSMAAGAHIAGRLADGR